VHLDGKYVYINSQGLNLFGAQSPDQIVGREVMTLLPPEEQQAIQQRISDLQAGAMISPLRDARVLRLDGTVVPVAAVGARITYQGKPAIQIVMADVSERKKAEAEMQQARAAAEAANAAKDQFIAAISHELRTPLTPVRAAVSALKADFRLPDDVRRELEIVHRNVDLETRLIDDLLDITRIARGKIELEKRALDLATVLQDAAVICSHELKTRGQTLSFEMPDAPHPLMADATRLLQVFWNLIQNAAKFTPERGRISIHARRDGDFVTVDVTDTGVGIDPLILPRLFNFFEQGDAATTRQFGGLGLGLAISKTIVAMHDGTICATSEGRNKGATFTVRLPLSSAGSTAAATGGDTPRSTSDAAQALDQSPALAGVGLRILLVEDHADTARVISRLLRSEGYDVIVAGTAAEAFESVASSHFDVMISDIGLPTAAGTSCSGSSTPPATDQSRPSR